MSRSRLLAVALLAPMFALASPDAAAGWKGGAVEARDATASTATAGEAPPREPGAAPAPAAWTWAPWGADARPGTLPPIKPPPGGC
jgi:hypothetical protein